MLIRFLPVALLCLAAAAAAAPVRPFAAVPHVDGAWWRTAPSIAIPPARLSLAWDASALYLHVSDAPGSGTLTLTNWLTLQAKDGPLTLQHNGEAVPSGKVSAAGGEWDASVPWAVLGVEGPAAGRYLPAHVTWSGGGSYVQVPSTMLGFDLLTWGVLELSARPDAEGCPTTLTKPFIYRFNPTPNSGRPEYTVEPEPNGLCLPIEVKMLAVGAGEPSVVATRRTAGGTARFRLPKVDTPYAGVELHVPGYAGQDGTVAFHGLAPGRKLAEFAGAPDWPVPADLDAFWRHARQELAAVPMNAKITEVKERATKTARVYRVDMDSIGGVRFSAWYTVPKDVDVAGGQAARRYPAVQVMPGYGAEETPIDRTADGYITFSVNPRGHGPSADFWPLPGDHLNWNIDDADKYYYRGAYMDCVRAIEFLRGRPEVDAARIGVEGGSQGGALALATAALADGVAACCANVPFLSDFPSAARLSTRGGLSVIGEALARPGAARTLSYIDLRHLSTLIHCPTLICAGEMDPICPPAGGVADYHALPAATPKRLLLVPRCQHEVPTPMRNANAQWFARYLKP